MRDVLTVLGVDAPNDGEIRLAAVVDTGAQMSMLPSDVLEAATIIERLPPVDVGGAVGEATARDVVRVTLRLLQHGGRPHVLPVIVGEVGRQALIGMDLLEREGLIIDTATGTLKAKERAKPSLPAGAEPIPGGGYVLNAPKGYARTIARLRFEAMQPRDAAPESPDTHGELPKTPSGYKVKR